MKFILRSSAALLLLLCLTGLVLRFCSNRPWSRNDAGTRTFFASYNSNVKSLDPATCYFVHESAILDNIAEPLLSYEYLKRPYTLKPQLLREIPVPRYFDHEGRLLSGNPPVEDVARVEYLLRIRPGDYYQPHPCFGENAKREVCSDDLRNALVRLCDPRLASPVYATLGSFIAGMPECSKLISREIRRIEDGQPPDERLYPCLPDYRKIPFAGMEIVDRHSCRLILKRKYPQVLYWMAMHFMAPVPWEALEYYHRLEIQAKGLQFKNNPVGSGAYMLEHFAPHQKIVLKKNPNYALGHPGEIVDLDRIYFHYERESIPNWIKFQQGYYDTSGIPGDMFDTAISLNASGELMLSGEMEKRGVYLSGSVSPIIYYFGFNMMDPVVGGLSEERRCLRQAISMVLDYQEYIDIFLNGQGVPAQSIIPPGIFGGGTTEEFCNPYTDRWDPVRKRCARRPWKEAVELMKAAGYPGGIGPDGRPLTLYLDHASAGFTDFKAQFQWLKGKLGKLGIQLEERASDLNRWRDKIQTGNWQLIFNKGWVGDYPDPENFLMLFYSRNAVVPNHGRGANYVNYQSPEYDRIFKRLETMQNTPERAELIRQAVNLIQRDAPCSWGFHPSKVVLSHGWLKNFKLHDIAYDTMRYLSLDLEKRKQCQKRWNRPVVWPVLLGIALLAVPVLGGMAWHRHREGKKG